ncbi:MAG: efflux RND transporter periplasmic adaptor subunit [Deltaproteobacteria bacterium]|nr:efflux RND transporter periplasmic adaptor subunit [Deltaproteobacteria bacterium]
MRLLPLLLALTLGCSGQAPEGPQRGGHAAPPTVVAIATAGPATLVEVLKTHATVESEAQADLYPTTTGRVLQVRRGEGDPVREGEVLAVLENATLDAGADRAASQLSKLEADLLTATSLHQRGALSDRDLAELRFQVEQAQVSAREAAKGREHTRITAPFSGVVAAQDVREGDTATAGRRAFQVVDMSRLRVVASLPEREVSRVRLGQVAILSPAYAPTERVEATVTRVSPVIDAASGTFRVTLSLPPDQGVLRPGQYVSVALAVAQAEDRLSVPRSAVVWEEGAAVIYRLGPPPEEEEKKPEETTTAGGWFASWGAAAKTAEDKGGTGEKGEKRGHRPQRDKATHTAERLPVTLGILDEERAEVLTGLDDGDPIITVGQALLRDGAPVITEEEAAAQRARREAAEAAEAAGAAPEAAE